MKFEHALLVRLQRYLPSGARPNVHRIGGLNLARIQRGCPDAAVTANKAAASIMVACLMDARYLEGVELF